MFAVKIRVNCDVEGNVPREDATKDVGSLIALYGHVVQAVCEHDILTAVRMEGEFQAVQRGLACTVLVPVIHQDKAH